MYLFTDQIKKEDRILIHPKSVWFIFLFSFKMYKIHIWYNIFHTFRYRPPHKPQNDIALVRVRGDPIKFSRDIMPICLPPGPRFPDLKGVVYVAGKFK